MIYQRRDAAALTAQERLCEIAEILARGYLRLRTSRQVAKDGACSAGKDLALNGKVEAQCGSMAHSPESRFRT